MNRLLWYLPGSFWAVVIFVLSVIPSKNFPTFQLFGFVPFDKVGHFMFYGMLAFLFMPPIYKQYAGKQGRLTAEMAMLLLVTGYGVAIEFVQRMPIVNRSFEVNDMVADGIGAFCGYLAYKLLLGWMKAAETPFS